MISMVLQTRGASPGDVSGALLHLEPVCAGLCAARDDRLTEVVPYLEAELATQTAQFDDVAQYVPNARHFHEALVARCGNESMILLIGSLEVIWSAHESAVWSGEGGAERDAATRAKTRRAALRDHHRIVDAIRDGNQARAVSLATDHLAAARHNTLGMDKTIEAKLISHPLTGRTIGDNPRQRRRPRAVRGRPGLRIATITFNNPKQRNSYDATMRDAVGRCLDVVAEDDDITVVLLRGAEGVFSTGADMNNAYGWYGDERLREEQSTGAKRIEAQEEQAQPAAPTDRGPQVIWLLSQSDGLPEGHGGGDRRLRARRRIRDGAHDRHLGDRARH